LAGNRKSDLLLPSYRSKDTLSKICCLCGQKLSNSHNYSLWPSEIKPKSKSHQNRLNLGKFPCVTVGLSTQSIDNRRVCPHCYGKNARNARKIMLAAEELKIDAVRSKVKLQQFHVSKFPVYMAKKTHIF
jgi:hypothetical protein